MEPRRATSRTQIEWETGRAGRPRGGRGALALQGIVVVASCLALAAMVAGADRLPSWSVSLGGVVAEAGPGSRVTTLVEDDGGERGAPANAAPSGGRRGGSGALGAPGASAATQYSFPTYPETETFAAKAGVHVLAPQWVPAGFVSDPLKVALGQLPPEQVSATGRPQRVAVTQRFAAPEGGTFTIVQSLPPPIFDLLDAGRAETETTLSNGTTVNYGEFPQGVIVYWREKGNARSIAVVVDQVAAARFARADWLRLAESLQ